MNTKVILNQDLVALGEEGDIKDVAKGYARNFLFPRGIALPWTPRTVQLFEKRKDEIEARKELKRKDALGLKEKIEGLAVTIIMPAGANGKLYGAVTNLTVSDELAKQGLAIERKRIEIPGSTIKNVGKYKAAVKLYGNASAELNVIVEAEAVKKEEKETHAEVRRHKHGQDAQTDDTGENGQSAANTDGEGAPADGVPVEGGRTAAAIDNGAADN
jgi:large subunit ribosomal protein L9